MKYKAVIETDNFKDFEFFEDGSGKYIVGRDAGAETDEWLAIYFTECEKGQIDVLNKIRTEIEQLPINTRTNWDGCCPDIDYPEIEYVDVTKDKLLSIIDKYIAESEGIAL